MTERGDDSNAPTRTPEPTEVGPPNFWCRAATRQQREDGTPKPCANRAGFSTTHPGKGRCKYHGGLQPGDSRLETGLHSDVLQTEDGERIAEILSQEGDPRDGMAIASALLRHLAERFVADHIAGQAGEIDPNLIEQGVKIMDRLSLVETRRSKSDARRSAPPERIQAVVALVVQAVERHADPETAAQVGRELHGEVVEAELVGD